MFKEKKTGLAALEERIYLTYYEDGVLDIFFGAMLFILGKQMLTHGETMAIAMPVAMGAGFLIKKLTNKRLGQVSFTEKRKEALDKFRRVMVAFLVTAMLVGLGVLILRSQMESDVSAHPKGLPLAVIMIIGFGLVARMVPLMHFAGYAVGFAALTALAILDGASLAYPFIASGTLVIMSGSYLLFGFLRRYPQSDYESDGEGDDD